jgi:O-antigen/teichoic acid export membrane protein
MILVMKNCNKATVSSKLLFVLSSIIVNVVNYIFNVLLGNILTPSSYGEATFYTTLTLMFSFLALMFQMTAARYAVLMPLENDMLNLRSFLNQMAQKLGAGIGLILLLFAPFMSVFFHINNIMPFFLLGITLPFYFLMSVGRGIYQGHLVFGRLAFSYQIEIWVKVVLTFILFYFFQMGAFSVLLSIIISFFVCFFYCLEQPYIYKSDLSKAIKGDIIYFFISVGLYEFSQILINNSDTLLAKAYLTPTLAGQYVALAMIGRVIFFSSFPILMVLIPSFVQKHNNGLPYRFLLYGSSFMCFLIIAVMIFICYYFADELILTLFGPNFLIISPFLWQYAVATGIFTICNIFIYYHLSLNQKRVIFISILAGLIQLFYLFLNHSSIQDFINAQWVAMFILLFCTTIFHFKTMNN